MEAKKLKDYDTIVETTNPDERDRIITALYREGREYYYTDRRKDGSYIVAYNKD